MTVVVDPKEKFEAAVEAYGCIRDLHGAERATLLLTKCLGAEYTRRVRLAYEKLVGVVMDQPEAIEVEI